MSTKSNNKVVKLRNDKSNPTETTDAIADVFRALDRNSDGKVSELDVLDALRQQGVLDTDPRYSRLKAKIKDVSGGECMTLPQFSKAVRIDFSLVMRAVKARFIIPKFSDFANEISNIFETSEKNKAGKVASYIPQLATVDPENFAVSICTVDGQRANFGNSETTFSVQSASKLISYAMALELNGETKVHRHVGREPSGKSFNELSLNPKNLPHNPLLNAGGIMSASLIKPSLPAAERFDYVLDTCHGSVVDGRRVTATPYTFPKK